MKDNMDLKDYRMQPDEGLFDKVAHRLVVRRAVRTAAVVGAVAVVGVVAVWLAVPTAKHATAEAQPLAVEQRDAAMVATVDRQQDDLVAMNAVAAPQAAVAAAPRQDAAAGQKEPVLPADRREPSVAAKVSALPGVGMPVAPAGQPTLPAAKVVAADTPMADLILETFDTTPQTKNPEVQTPHQEKLLLAPTVIVPAADDEVNRTFGVLAAETVSDFRLALYNRGGRQVYSTDNIAFRWDATFDGQPVPQGAYVWVAQFRDSEGNPHRERGTVVVVR